MFKKMIPTLVLSVIIAFTSFGASFAAEPQIGKLAKTSEPEISIEKYLSILPFELSTEDKTAAKKILNAINEAFNKNELSLAQKKMDEFYDIVSKYWMSKSTLKILLPFDNMMKFGSDLFTEEEKKQIQEKFNKLSQLREENKFEEYFTLIKYIHNKYYDILGKSIGDANSELQLIQYIKGGDQLTPEDLVNYDFKDYLEILPFKISYQDMVKGQKIFDRVVDKLKTKKFEEAKKITGELNDLMAPYWIKDDTLNVLIPLEKYKKEAIQYLSKKNQLELNKIYEIIKEAQKKEDFDMYFTSIDKYFSKLGQAIKEYFNDFFDEIVFYRS